MYGGDVTNAGSKRPSRAGDPAADPGGLYGAAQAKPIQSISIKELCEVAGINRGTFYAHYRDIYDLREKIESDMYRDVLGELKPLLDSDAKATQREITTAVFQWMRENRDMCEVVLGEYGDRSFLWKMLDLGRMVCQESYQRMFEGASPRDISWFTPMPAGDASDFCAGGCGRTWKRPRAKSRASPSS